MQNVSVQDLTSSSSLSHQKEASYSLTCRWPYSSLETTSSPVRRWNLPWRAYLVCCPFLKHSTFLHCRIQQVRIPRMHLTHDWPSSYAFPRSSSIRLLGYNGYLYLFFLRYSHFNWRYKDGFKGKDDFKGKMGQIWGDMAWSNLFFMFINVTHKNNLLLRLLSWAYQCCPLGKV